MSQIRIPKPCNENWDKMLPEAQGKHCLACSKTVIDFSDWEQDQIIEYLQSRSQEKVCGRFNVTQVDTAIRQNDILHFIISSNVSLLKKIAAIVLLCFGVMAGTDSYAQKPTGEAVISVPPQTQMLPIVGKPALPPQKDTVNVKPTPQPKCEPQIMGMIRQYPAPKTKKAKQPITAPSKTVPAKKS